jgi:hypothetical protein
MFQIDETHMTEPKAFAGWMPQKNIANFRPPP